MLGFGWKIFPVMILRHRFGLNEYEIMTNLNILSESISVRYMDYLSPIVLQIFQITAFIYTITNA